MPPPRKLIFSCAGAERVGAVRGGCRRGGCSWQSSCFAHACILDHHGKNILDLPPEKHAPTRPRPRSMSSYPHPKSIPHPSIVIRARAARRPAGPGTTSSLLASTQHAAASGGSPSRPRRPGKLPPITRNRMHRPRRSCGPWGRRARGVGALGRRRRKTEAVSCPAAPPSRAVARVRAPPRPRSGTKQLGRCRYHPPRRASGAGARGEGARGAQKAPDVGGKGQLTLTGMSSRRSILDHSLRRPYA